MSTTQLTVTTQVQAPVAKAWAAFTQPVHITQWNFADPSWHCPSAENDLRPGGTYKAHMAAKDGSASFDFIAVYDEVQPTSKLAYTMPDGRHIVTTFEESGDATQVTTVFDAEAQNSLELQQAGWQAILNNFKRYTEAQL